MIDIKKILEHLDKQIVKYKVKMYRADCSTHINSFMAKLEFLEKLRAALTIEEEDEKN